MTIEKIGVIGAGQMGNGIAHVCAVAGFDVGLNDLNKAQIEADRAGRMKEARRLATMLKSLNDMPLPLIGRIEGVAMGGEERELGNATDISVVFFRPRDGVVVLVVVVFAVVVVLVVVVIEPFNEQQQPHVTNVRVGTSG